MLGEHLACSSCSIAVCSSLAPHAFAFSSKGLLMGFCLVAQNSLEISLRIKLELFLCPVAHKTLILFNAFFKTHATIIFVVFYVLFTSCVK